MRFWGTIAIAASLAATPAVRAEPLAPGKPAGVHAARNGASTGFLIAGGILVAGLVAVLAFNNGGNNNGVIIPTNNTGTNP